MRRKTSDEGNVNNIIQDAYHRYVYLRFGRVGDTRLACTILEGDVSNRRWQRVVAAERNANRQQTHNRILINKKERTRDASLDTSNSMSI